MLKWPLRISFLMLILMLPGLPAHAAEATDWQEAAYSEVRLISATGVPFRGRQTRAAALQIGLESGWKTYWRTPGEGFPPLIRFDASENLADARLLWPTPQRLPDAAGLLAFGYKDKVTLPILIEPDDASRPVKLVVEAWFGVCADICIPVQLELEHTVPPTPHEAYRRTLAKALQRVPTPQSQAAHCPHAFVAARRGRVDGNPAVIVETAVEADASGLDLFAEAPDGVTLPAPIRQPDGSSGRLHHTLVFDSEDSVAALSGRKLTLTMAADQGSCEAEWRVK